MLLFLFAAVAAEPTPSPRLQSADDYPLEAVANGWQGDVVADLTISQTGAVTGRRVIKSSGHQVLDDATCKELTKRARFSPARDKKGNPVEGHFTAPTIRWRLGP